MAATQNTGNQAPEGTTATCAACAQEITLLGGHWTDLDGCTACYADLSTAYVPHKPTESR